MKNNLELVIGCVCSGKSEELLRRVNRYRIAGFSVLLLKPKIDTRSKGIRSRNGSSSACHELASIGDIYKLLSGLKAESDLVIALDEAQFYPGLYPVVKDLLVRGHKVIVSALDSDYNGEPFGDIPKLVTLSDDVLKLTAICMSCLDDNAIFSQKLKKGGNQIEIGDLETYQPRCLKCFVPGGLSKK